MKKNIKNRKKKAISSTELLDSLNFRIAELEKTQMSRVQLLDDGSVSVSCPNVLQAEKIAYRLAKKQTKRFYTNFDYL